MGASWENVQRASAFALRAHHLQTTEQTLALWAHHSQTTGRTQHLSISRCVACASFANDRERITLVHQQLRCVRSINLKTSEHTQNLRISCCVLACTAFSNDRADATLVHQQLHCVHSICKRQSTQSTCASAAALRAQHLQTTERT